jgi:rubrerythrin
VAAVIVRIDTSDVSSVGLCRVYACGWRIVTNSEASTREALARHSWHAHIKREDQHAGFFRDARMRTDRKFQRCDTCGEHIWYHSGPQRCDDCLVR